MKRIYLTPSATCIEMEAEPVMTNTSVSGDINGGSGNLNPASNKKDHSSPWNEKPFGKSSNDIWN